MKQIKMQCKLLTCCERMAGVQADAHPRLIRDQINDLSQLGEFSTNCVTLAAHILDHCSKQVKTMNPTQ